VIAIIRNCLRGDRGSTLKRSRPAWERALMIYAETVPRDTLKRSRLYAETVPRDTLKRSRPYAETVPRHDTVFNIARAHR